MNKTAKIIISIMSMVLVILLVYARILANESEKKGMEAEDNMFKAIEAQKIADKQAMFAEQEAAKARVIANEALKLKKELDECRGSK